MDISALIGEITNRHQATVQNLGLDFFISGLHTFSFGLHILVGLHA